MNFRLYSQRAAAAKGDIASPTTRSFSAFLRRQIIATITDAIGMYFNNANLGPGNDEVDTTYIWDEFDRHLFKLSPEYGDFDFPSHANPKKKALAFMAGSSDAGFLDALDLAVALIGHGCRAVAQRGVNHMSYCEVRLTPDQALLELDRWLREAGSVYRVAQGSIVVSNDDFTHDAVIVPALQWLRSSGFESAAREFDEAVKAYRNGPPYHDVITKANHAFESTMKVIAGTMGWKYEQTWTAKPLIALMIENGLISKMRESAMTGLRTLLESDLPTMRNKTPGAGHGAGEATDDAVSEPIASYALAVCAANINLLMGSFAARLRSAR